MIGSHDSHAIARALGRSRDSVKYRAKRLGLSLQLVGDASPRTRYSDELIEKARTLHDKGYGPRWIAKRLQINENTLRSALYYQQRLNPALPPNTTS